MATVVPNCCGECPCTWPPFDASCYLIASFSVPGYCLDGAEVELTAVQGRDAIVEQLWCGGLWGTCGGALSVDVGCPGCDDDGYHIAIMAPEDCHAHAQLQLVSCEPFEATASFVMLQGAMDEGVCYGGQTVTVVVRQKPW